MSRCIQKSKRKNGRQLLQWSLIGIIVSLTGCTFDKTYGDVGSGNSLYTPSAVSVSDKTLYWRQEIKKAALNMIKLSRKVCYLSMYELGDPDLLQALANAHKRGVDVRLVLDATEKHTLDTAIPFLKQEGIPYHLYRVNRGISHIKSLVTDSNGSYTTFDELMGGMNFGPHSWNNLDASVFIHATNSDFERLFLHDWTVSAGNDEPQEHSSQFVIDQQIEPAMLQAIQTAQHSIDIEIFDLTDAECIQHLLAAQRRGVHVRVLMEPTEKQNHQTAKRLEQAGVEVKFYRHVDHEILHAKLLSIDQGNIIFVGSANFTHQGFHVNHEGDTVIRNVPQFAESIRQSLDMEWKRSQ